MSRRPGIGHAWIDKYFDDCVRTECVTIDGREFAIPHRYIAWHEGRFDKLKEARRERFAKMPIDVKMKRSEGLRNKELNYLSRKSQSKEVI